MFSMTSPQFNILKGHWILPGRRWCIQGSRESLSHSPNVCSGTHKMGEIHTRWERAKGCLIFHLSWELLLGLGTTGWMQSQTHAQMWSPQQSPDPEEMSLHCSPLHLTRSSPWCLMLSHRCPSPWGWQLPAGTCSFLWFCSVLIKEKVSPCYPTWSWTPTFKPSSCLSWD